MPDARLFAKFDLGYFDNPKIADFVEDHPRVIFLHQRAFLYCRQHLTDGEFPVRLVARMVGATYCGSQCEAECDYCRGVHSGLFEQVDKPSLQARTERLAFAEPIYSEPIVWGLLVEHLEAVAGA